MSGTNTSPFDLQAGGMPLGMADGTFSGVLRASGEGSVVGEAGGGVRHLCVFSTGPTHPK